MRSDRSSRSPSTSRCVGDIRRGNPVGSRSQSSIGPGVHPEEEEKAVLEHGGDATNERNAFKRLSTEEKSKLIAFLENLILFKAEEEEEE